MEETIRIWLGDEEGNEYEYEMVVGFALAGKQYMAIAPVSDGEPDVENCMLVRFTEEAGELSFFEITDADEYAAAAEIFTDIAENGVELPDEPQAGYEAEEEYCYQDAEGNLFIFDEIGNKIYLNEFGEEI